MALFSTPKAFYIGDIFFFFLGSNINTYQKGVLASFLFLSTTMPRTSLVVLVFFLVGGRCLLLTRYVRREDVDRLIFFKILIFLFCQSVLLETLGINLQGAIGQLQQRFCLCIDGFLNGLFSGVCFLTSTIQLCPNRRFQAFSEVSNHNLLLWSYNRVKFFEDRLQVLSVSCHVKDFLQLILEITFNLFPIAIYKSLEVPQTFTRKCLELVSGHLGSAVGVVFLLVLLLAEADLVLKKKRSKGNLVNPLNSSGDKVVFTLLTKVVGLYIRLSALHIWRTGF